MKIIILLYWNKRSISLEISSWTAYPLSHYCFLCLSKVPSSSTTFNSKVTQSWILYCAHSKHVLNQWALWTQWIQHTRSGVMSLQSQFKLMIIYFNEIQVFFICAMYNVQRHSCQGLTHFLGQKASNCRTN